MTVSLRREIAHLRSSNKMLSDQNIAYVQRLIEAQQRVEALLAQLPAPEQDPAETQAEANE
jgi:hypothetical protein